MKKSLLLFGIFLLLAGFKVNAQDSYYIIKNVKTLNPTFQLILKEDRNVYDPFYEIKIRIKDSVHVFTAKEVREYKRNGKIYKMERLPESGKEVFMEVLEDGPLRLYFITDKRYRNRFFLRKGDELIEIKNEKKGRENFQRVLRKSWEQCRKARKLVKIAEYNRTSLRRTIRAHNTCSELYIPHFKFYISGGVGFTTPELSYGTNVYSLAFENIYRNFPYAFELNYTGNIGLSFPINQTDFSLETGLRMQVMDFNYSAVFSLRRPFDRTFRSKMSLVDLSVPLDIQYTIPRIKYRPFVRFGLSPHYFVRSNMTITEELESFGSGDNEITVSEEQLKKLGIGINLAVGVQQQISEKNEVFITLGYHRRGATLRKRIYNFSTFYCMMGYAF